MSKIKKILVLMIMILGIMFLSNNSVKALNETYRLNLDDLNSSSNLYCVNHGQPLNSYKPVNKPQPCPGLFSPHYTYDIWGKRTGVKICTETEPNTLPLQHKKNHIWEDVEYEYTRYTYTNVGDIYINLSRSIEGGNVAVYGSRQTTNELNAKMAYVLANGTGYSSPSYFTRDWRGNYSQSQMAVYYYFYNFINQFRSFGSNSAWDFVRDYGYDFESIPIVKEANTYWENLQRWQQSGGELTDNTIKDNSGNVATTLERYNNNNYFKMGPLNWNYSGSITNLTVTDQNGNSISGIKYGRQINGSFVEVGTDAIRSDSNFYILIPAESGVSGVRFSVSIQSNVTVYWANIQLLNHSNLQKLIKVDGGPQTVTKSGNVSLSYNFSIVDLTIQKRDVYNKNQPIPNVTFTLQHKATGLYVAKNSRGNRIYVTSESQAERFTTGSNGDVVIRGIVAGEYIAKEVNITNTDYTLNTGRTKVITVTANRINIATAYNIVKQKDVTIQGQVWTPQKEGKSEDAVTSVDASVYERKISLLVEGITVELWKNGELVEVSNANGELTDVKMKEKAFEKIATTKTGSNGEYSFKTKLNYAELELPYYEVRFTYDSMDFQGCPIQNYNDKLYGSKAIEDASQRATLNNNYAVITGTENNNLNKGYIRNSNNGVVKDLTYNYTPGKDGSKIGKSTVTGLTTGYTKSEDNVKINNSDNIINPIIATYSLKPGNPAGNPGGFYYITGNTVQGINLALITRENPDLTVSNQIANVVTTVNGYNNLYKTTLTRTNTDPNNSDLKVGVTYVTDEDKLSKFTVYPSDVKTWADDNITDKLQVYITYKVGITNESTSLYNKVRELAIYYDSNYELQYIGDNLDENKYNYSATGDYGVKNSKYSNSNMNGYTKVCIEVNGVINPNDTKNIYMTFKVSDNEVRKMLYIDEVTGKPYKPEMKNVVEINAYSTYSDAQGTKLYAGIDKDSAPGNMTNPDQIDDDTGVAKEFTIKQDGTRTLEGTVFLDKTADELMKGKERKGDSIYNSNEDKILKDVKVELVGQNDNSTSKNIITGKTTVTKTEGYNYNATEDGTGYNISGFIPGSYIIKYTYGNNTYYMDGTNKVNINTVDYKSAIVKDVAGKTEVKTAFKTGKTDWYKLDNGNGSYTRYNEAVDDWQTRTNIDANYKSLSISNTGDATKNNTTSMTAQTPVMGIAVELNTTSNGNTYTPQYYELKNMDFGITERPRQDMKLNKEVSNIKITLANGQVLIDATIVNGKVTETVSGLKYVGVSTSTPKGLVDIELDSELIHGATLEIIYSIKAENTSELDYLEEEYYKYGTGGKTEVSITPGTVVDYVSNDLVYDENTVIDYNSGLTNSLFGWKIVELEDIEAQIDKKGILYRDIKNNEIAKENINTIIKTDYLSKEALTPGKQTRDENTLKLGLTKLISNSEEDMTYNNDVEVITATKTGGRTIVNQLGTYTFEEGGVGGSAEEITITPPTGILESNTMHYVIIAIATVALLTTGLVFISLKRKNK